VEKTLVAASLDAARSSVGAVPVTDTQPDPGRSTPARLLIENPIPWVTAPSSRNTGLADTNLFTRQYQLDLNNLAQSLASMGPMKGTNLAANLREFFVSLGVDLQPPRTMFFHDRTGGLLVRAPQADLDIVEKALKVINATPPQVNIKAKFVEVPADQWGVWLGKINGTTNQTDEFTGILTDPQFRMVTKALEQTKGVEILNLSDVTTLSGRQAQIQAVDIRTIVTGVAPLMTNGMVTNTFQTASVPFGPTLDVIAYVAADGFTMQLTVIPTVTEFLGYEKPDPALVVGGVSPAVALPHFRLRQVTTTAKVWDGQTVVLGGLPSQAVTRLPDGTESRRTAPDLDKKHLLVFITPTIIDQGGNRRADGPTPSATVQPAAR
jgi:type II secretory pathway component GspD/PulD (secretin)